MDNFGSVVIPTKKQDVDQKYSLCDDTYYLDLRGMKSKDFRGGFLPNGGNVAFSDITYRNGSEVIVMDFVPSSAIARITTNAKEFVNQL